MDSLHFYRFHPDKSPCVSYLQTLPRVSFDRNRAKKRPIRVVSNFKRM